MLPKPEDQPLLRPADLLTLHPDLRRSAVYDAIKKGDLPSIKIGSRIYIPTASIRFMLHLDEHQSDRNLVSALKGAVHAQPSATTGEIVGSASNG